MQVNIRGKECRLVICLHPISVSIHLYIIRPPPWKKGSHAPVASHSRYPISPFLHKHNFTRTMDRRLPSCFLPIHIQGDPCRKTEGSVPPLSLSLDLSLKSKLSFRCNLSCILDNRSFPYSSRLVC